MPHAGEQSAHQRQGKFAGQLQRLVALFRHAEQYVRYN